MYGICCLTDKTLFPCSYSMSFYFFRALEEVELYEDTYSLWRIWFDLLDMHLTTWPEDSVTQRSDCHGWGSIALYEMSACILGVKPLEPGMRHLLIEPKQMALPEVEGAVPTAGGIVKVKRTVKNGSMRLEIVLPEVIDALVRLPSEKHEISGPGRFVFLSSLNCMEGTDKTIIA